MSSEDELRARLRKIEALFAGAGVRRLGLCAINCTQSNRLRDELPDRRVP